MIPLWVAAVFVALVTMFIAVEIPRHEQEKAAISSDVAATNMLAYRKGVQDYLKANPAFAGSSVADADMAAGCGGASCFPLGYIRNMNWSNIVESGALYIYSTMPADPNLLSALDRKLGTTTLLGRKNTVTDHLVTTNGRDTGIVLPAAIPDDQIVIGGR